ncbi:MAG: tRNA uridine-5-carboxymethylaminomethyl(34) synthesis GTPase MnmE [Hyphomicrobiaceae bacterium]
MSAATPSDTIYALSSAPGRAAIAVVRISGPQVPDLLARLAPPVPAPRKAVVRQIRHPKSRAVIDRGLVVYFSERSSATGEALLELHVHGGRAVLNAIFDALSNFDRCRPAEAGEFARRAFDNGKLDLTAAEGLADLVDAETEAQRRQAQRQADGALARLYEEWRAELIRAQGFVEAAIDFSDESDVGESTYLHAHAIAQNLNNQILAHVAGAYRGEIVRDGFRIVIAGPPNAGKSSLLNALARRDAAIVSAEEGTTRDVIEVRLDIGGYFVVVSDTAGLRKTQSLVEQEGVRRTLARASEADLVLWLQDGTAKTHSRPPPGLSEAAVQVVLTKADLGSCADWVDRADTLNPAGMFQGATANFASAIAVSAKTGQGLGELTQSIVTILEEYASSAPDVVPTNARHRAALADTAGHLEMFLRAGTPTAKENGQESEQEGAQRGSPQKALENGSQHALAGAIAHHLENGLELRAEDLRLAALALGRITGRIDSEDVLDEIFSRFCIGK